MVPIFVEHWGDNLQFHPNFALFSTLGGGMNLDHDFVQVCKFSEDQKKKQMEHFFPQIQVKTKKKRFSSKIEHFFPKFTLRCTLPIQTIGGIQPNYWGDISPPCFGTPETSISEKTKDFCAMLFLFLPKNRWQYYCNTRIKIKLN